MLLWSANIGREFVLIRQPVQIVEVVSSTYGRLHLRRKGQEPVLLCNSDLTYHGPCRLDLAITQEEIDLEAPALAIDGEGREQWSTLGYYLPQTELAEQAPSLKG